jgi:2-amino-4-hydroxy-6-hydroxymethyldihydropteridine diphosphokinase
MVNDGGIFIALGSNLGDREENIRSALRALGEAGDVRVLRCSSLHETEPVGGPPGQGRYLNAAAELQTDLSPRELLARLLEIERRHGRARTERFGPRTLDLDLLLYHHLVIAEPDLTVPHPRMWVRPFVMGPLSEICAPDRLAAARQLQCGTADRCRPSVHAAPHEPRG